MFADAKKVKSAAVAAGGSGYAVNDVLVVDGGTVLYSDPVDDFKARFLVAAVDGGGAVTSVALLSAGRYAVAPGTANSPAGGSGSGAELTLTLGSLWDAKAWVVPVRADLSKVLSWEAIAEADQNTAAGTDPAEETDTAQPTRASTLLAAEADELRSRVQQCGKVPLSLTDGSVPPVAFMHVLYAAAYKLVGSTPSLAAKQLLDMKMDSPLAQGYKRASEFYDKVSKGFNVDFPTDPDPTWDAGVKLGSYAPPADLSTNASSIVYGTANLGAF